MHPEAAGRVRETLGDGIKLIVVFRDPARRAYSQYLMSRKKELRSLGSTKHFRQKIPAGTGPITKR